MNYPRDARAPGKRAGNWVIMPALPSLCYSCAIFRGPKIFQYQKKSSLILSNRQIRDIGKKTAIWTIRIDFGVRSPRGQHVRHFE